MYNPGLTYLVTISKYVLSILDINSPYIQYINTISSSDAGINSKEFWVETKEDSVVPITLKHTYTHINSRDNFNFRLEIFYDTANRCYIVKDIIDFPTKLE